MMIDVRPRSSVSNARSMRISVGPVDVRGRLVEDQDARVGDQRARDRDQLALAGREAGAALAHDVVEPVLEARRNAVDADRARRVDDLLVGRVGTAEADVVGDRAAEEERVLQHDAELAAVRAELTSRRSFPSTRTVPARRVVEARDQLRRRRLAAARLADERDAAAGRDLELEAVDHRLAAVGEDDPVELDATVERGRARSRPGRSTMSGSASSTVEIFPIAALAACTWP